MIEVGFSVFLSCRDCGFDARHELPLLDSYEMAPEAGDAVDDRGEPVVRAVSPAACAQCGGRRRNVLTDVTG